MIPSWAEARTEPYDVIPDRKQRPINCDVCPVASYTFTMRMVKAAETASSEQQVGDHLRDVRTQQGFSVRALAARAGCSPSFISQVEHGQASPSISSLERLVQALGMTLGDFFRVSAPPVVMRSHERVALTDLLSGARIEALTPAGAGYALEPLLITLEPGGQSGSQPYARRGDEFAFVCEGDVQLTLDETTHRLTRGDAATYSGETPRRWENVGRGPARIVVVSARTH
jgi:transcriptional regulator with XRE-family HTH domain